MTNVFVTASGTEVGKTHVTALLLAELREAGLRARALKPIATGFGVADAGSSDSGRLLRALGLPVTAGNLDAVSPWRFAAPLSPNMAAARERRTIPFGALLEFCEARADADVTLIEGIGGVMVPIDENHTVLDWIAALRAPSLLVTGSYLGSLSHALTAAGMLDARGCALGGVIVDESPEQPVAVEETVATLARFLRPVPVRIVPREPDSAGGRSRAPAPPLLGLIEPFLPIPARRGPHSRAPRS